MNRKKHLLKAHVGINFIKVTKRLRLLNLMSRQLLAINNAKQALPFIQKRMDTGRSLPIL